MAIVRGVKQSFLSPTTTFSTPTVSANALFVCVAILCIAWFRPTQLMWSLLILHPTSQAMILTWQAQLPGASPLAVCSARHMWHAHSCLASLRFALPLWSQQGAVRTNTIDLADAGALADFLPFATTIMASSWGGQERCLENRANACAGSPPSSWA